MTSCLFVSDLHGHRDRYEKLFSSILVERPNCVFLGGDLMPSGLKHIARGEPSEDEFLNEFLVPHFAAIKRKLGDAYPRVFLILGNDDSALMEKPVRRAESLGLWHYMHNRADLVKGYTVYGYSCIPPSPFLSKDWERYDVSRYVDPGCVSPEEGWHALPHSLSDSRYGTIKGDLAMLTGEDDLTGGVVLFHAPPYRSLLDRAALDNKMIDHVPLDVHVGSIAIRRFIEERQPWITLHGHIHESARLTGNWREKIGRTHLLSAAHDGDELALIRFNLEEPERARRELL